MLFMNRLLRFVFLSDNNSSAPKERYTLSKFQLYATRPFRLPANVAFRISGIVPTHLIFHRHHKRDSRLVTEVSLFYFLSMGFHSLHGGWTFRSLFGFQDNGY